MRGLATIGRLAAALLWALALAPASSASAAAGQLYGFGENAAGQLASTSGNGSEVPNPAPSLLTLPGATGPVVETAAGGRFTLALTSTNQLYAFGDNRYGQLGVAAGSGAPQANPTPQQVELPGASGRVAQLAAGFSHSLVLTSTGELYTFGENQLGQLGRAANVGTESANHVPERIVLPGATGQVVQIAAGHEHSLALTSTGQLYAFGGTATESSATRRTQARAPPTRRRRSCRCRARAARSCRSRPATNRASRAPRRVSCTRSAATGSGSSAKARTAKRTRRTRRRRRSGCQRRRAR